MTLTPFLMFVGQAEEAMNLYVSVFPDAEILELERYGIGDSGNLFAARVSDDEV